MKVPLGEVNDTFASLNCVLYHSKSKELSIILGGIEQEGEVSDK
jgi:hypothetical protein